MYKLIHIRPQKNHMLLISVSKSMGLGLTSPSGMQETGANLTKSF